MTLTAHTTASALRGTPVQNVDLQTSGLGGCAGFLDEADLILMRSASDPRDLIAIITAGAVQTSVTFDRFFETQRDLTIPIGVPLQAHLALPILNTLLEDAGVDATTDQSPFDAAQAFGSLALVMSNLPAALAASNRAR
jgi:hypothetical protein